MKLDAAAIRAMKGRVRIPVLTAYTAPVARSLARAGIQVVVVGDSVGMAEMGFANTRDVSLDHIAYHVGAVRRGAPALHIVGDLPSGTYDSPEAGLQSARVLLAAGADSIKLEGPACDVIACLVGNGISVVGHAGLTPQTARNFRQVGREPADAARVLQAATAIAQAGAFMMIVEHVPADLGTAITAAVDIPTIGIGAGDRCDGQVMVINDLLGIGERWPPFSRQYAQVSRLTEDVVQAYIRDVRG